MHIGICIKQDHKVYTILIMTKTTRLGIFFILLIGFVGMSASTLYLYQKVSTLTRQPVKQESNRAASEALKDPKILIETVGKLIVLPVGEEPTIATVSDPTKLKDQPFFANAKEGDKVLIYQKAKQAYLYSVSQNKLIDVAPINVGATSQGTTTPTATQPAVIKNR